MTEPITFSAEQENQLIQSLLAPLVIGDEPVDALFLGLFSDERPLLLTIGYVDWRLNGIISKRIRKGHVTGSTGELTLIPSQGRLKPSRIILMGLGARGNYQLRDWTQTLQQIAQTAIRMKLSHVQISKNSFADLPSEQDLKRLPEPVQAVLVP